MSTLTKIFVILVTVFAVAFVTPTVIFVAKTHDWKARAEDYQTRALAAQAAARAKETELTQAQQTHREELNKLTERVALLENQISDLNKTVADAKLQLAEAQRNEQAAKSQIAELAAALKHNAAEREALNQELSQHRQSSIRLQTQLAQAEGRIKELTIDLQRTIDRWRFEQQRVAAFQRQNDELRDKLELAKRGVGPEEEGFDKVAGAPTPTRAAPIKGIITNVQGNLAELSVGSADGVKEGMTFYIYRGDKYLANLKITTVDPDGAGGELTLVRGEVKPDDEAINRLEF